MDWFGSLFGDLFSDGGGEALGGVPEFLAAPQPAQNFTDQNIFADFGVPSNYQPGDVAGDFSNYAYSPQVDYSNSQNFSSPVSGLPDFMRVDTQQGAQPANGTTMIPQLATAQPSQTAVSPVNAPTPSTPSAAPEIDPWKVAKSKGSSILDFGKKYAMPLLAVGGALSNYAGAKKTQAATQQGQQNYLDAVSWTPQKTENYMNALRSNVTSLYGNQAQGQNKAMAASNAARGRGGGTYGNQTQATGREMRSNIAQALNEGALTTNRPNTNLPMSAFAQTSPEGDTLTGIGGIMGSNLKSMQDQEAWLRLLQQLQLK